MRENDYYAWVSPEDVRKFNPSAFEKKGKNNVLVFVTSGLEGLTTRQDRNNVRLLLEGKGITEARIVTKKAR